MGLGLCDEWLGIDVALKTSRPTDFWTFPIETVSQSEGGFELVHQSTVVQPHWLVDAGAGGPLDGDDATGVGHQPGRASRGRGLAAAAR